MLRSLRYFFSWKNGKKISPWIPSANFSTKVELTSERIGSFKSLLNFTFKDSHGAKLWISKNGYEFMDPPSYNKHVTRGNFSVINENDIKYFQGVVGHQGVSTDLSDLVGYNTDWLNSYRGGSKLLLKPKTTPQVQSILKYCNDRCIAVVPQGGNTGLVGGSVPVFDEIIISTTLMNQIISLDEWSNVLVCEAGCVLETLNEYLMERNLIMPLDLGAKGSCTIGGNASTNAGGLRLLRYGSLHSTILGIEAVLADGTVMDCLTTMKKDNTGYDLKHLFIGSEGTLGFITKIAIQCPTKPTSVNLVFLGLKNYQNVLEMVKLAKENLGEILSSCEYMDSKAIQSVLKNLKLNSPIPQHPFYMLIECSGSNDAHDQEKLTSFLESVISSNIVEHGTVAFDNSQAEEIWALRERIPQALLQDGYVYSYDLSIPITHFDQLVQDTNKHLGPLVLGCCGFGHLGDGNIHLNVIVPKYDSKASSKIDLFIFDWIRDKKGSISAEHGLGFTKRNFITYSKPEESVNIMNKIKQLFDPNGILNPYKVLPSTLQL